MKFILRGRDVVPKYSEAEKEFIKEKLSLSKLEDLYFGEKKFKVSSDKIMSFVYGRTDLAEIHFDDLDLENGFEYEFNSPIQMEFNFGENEKEEGCLEDLETKDVQQELPFKDLPQTKGEYFQPELDLYGPKKLTFDEYLKLANQEIIKLNGENTVLILISSENLSTEVSIRNDTDCLAYCIRKGNGYKIQTHPRQLLNNQNKGEFQKGDDLQSDYYFQESQAQGHEIGHIIDYSILGVWSGRRYEIPKGFEIRETNEILIDILSDQIRVPKLKLKKSVEKLRNLHPFDALTELCLQFKVDYETIISSLYYNKILRECPWRMELLRAYPGWNSSPYLSFIYSHTPSLILPSGIELKRLNPLDKKDNKIISEEHNLCVLSSNKEKWLGDRNIHGIKIADLENDTDYDYRINPFRLEGILRNQYFDVILKDGNPVLIDYNARSHKIHSQFGDSESIVYTSKLKIIDGRLLTNYKGKQILDSKVLRSQE